MACTLQSFKFAGCNKPKKLKKGVFIVQIGYMRVSTENQCISRQEALMNEMGVEKVFQDIASGKNSNRQQLNDMLSFVREGDTVVVESYSRIARSTNDLIKILDTLQNKGVQFISKKESIDTTTSSGRLMFTIFAGLSQFERECMLERQAEGIVEAKKAGKYKGRKPLEIDTDKFKNVYQKWKSGQLTATAAQKQLGLSPSTFYRRIKEFEKK